MELLLCTEQRQGLHSSLSGAQPVLEAAAPAEDVCAKSEVAQDNLAKLNYCSFSAQTDPLRDAARARTTAAEVIQC